MKPSTGLIAVGLSALLALPLNAQEDIRAKVDKLEEELRVLKQQLAETKEASEQKFKIAPVLTAGADGLTFRSGDSNFLLKLHGYVQADARFYPADAAGGAPNDTFLLRRVRTIFEGSVYQKFEYRMMLDFGAGFNPSTSNNALVQDGYVNFHATDWFQVQAGKYKAPISLDRLQPDAYLTFVERSYTSQLAPNRDVGVEFKGDLFDKRFSYAIGVFNGAADNDSNDIETVDDDKEIEGRVFFNPFKQSKIKAIQKIGFGLGGSIGNMEGPLKSFVSPGQQTMFGYTPAVTANGNPVTVTADGEHWRLAPQGYYYVGPFGAFGEYIISEEKLRKTNPNQFGRFQNHAWSVNASYFLTGEENSFEPVRPKRNFHPTEGGWGAWQLVARIQQIDLDDRLFPLFSNPNTSATGASSWGVGVNWLLNPNVKISLNYEDTDFQGGKTSPVLQKGEKVIMTRAQLAF